MSSLRRLLDELKCRLFILRGRKPWSPGYQTYKLAYIQKVLAAGNFDVQQLPQGYGVRLDERVVEYPWLFARLPAAPGRLLDAGSILNYEFLLSQPALKTKQVFIETLAPESRCYWQRGISYLYGDLRETSFRDGYFDWIVSLSTLEHVGLDNTRLYTDDPGKKEDAPGSHLLAIREFRRILQPGGRLYLSLPFGRYRSHGWFQVFDREMVGKIIETFDPRAVDEYYYKYEPEGWRRSSWEDSREATYFDIHEQKTYDRDYAAASRALVCLEMLK